MSWHERMNQTIDYIEKNLLENVDIKKAALIAGQTPASFQRTFSIVTDMSICEYVRRRKMTLAAFELQNSDIKVIDTALKYGYESPEAFTRAFKDIHGVSPSAARGEGIELKSFPRLTFLLTVKGDAAMDYKIETKEAFSVYGIEGNFSCTNGDAEVPLFFDECENSGKMKKLTEAFNGNGRLCSICDYKQTDNDTFYYMIAVEASENKNCDEYKRIDIPAATWAIFKTEKIKFCDNKTGTDIFQNMIKRIYTEWLPTANYIKQDLFEVDIIHYYKDGYRHGEKWIRVVHK